MGIFDKLFGNKKRIVEPIVTPKKAEDMRKPRQQKPNVHELKEKGDIEGLIEALQHSDKEVRREAIFALGDLRLKAKDAVPALIKLLKDVDVPGLQNLDGLEVYVDSISNHAILALQDIGIIPEEAISVLMSNLKHTDTMVRESSLIVLGKIYKNALESDKDNIVTALITGLKDKHAQVRNSAAYGLEIACMSLSLSHIEPPLRKALPVLIEAFRDEDNYVREHAASAVSYFGIEAVPGLVRALKDINPQVYETAASVIGVNFAHIGIKIDDKMHRALIPAIQYLSKIVEDAKILQGPRSYDQYVGRAIGTLGFIGDSSALPALEKLLKKVQSKMEKEGNVSQFVNTGIAAGYVSLKDEINAIESVIDEILNRPF